MPIAFFDDPIEYLNFCPLTYTRPISELRLGILKISEKWSYHLGPVKGYFTADHLQEKFPEPDTGTFHIYIRSTLVPDGDLIQAISSLKPGSGLIQDDKLLAAHCKGDPINSVSKEITYINPCTILERSWDLVGLVGQEIERDLESLDRTTLNRKVNDPHTIVYGDNLYVGQDVDIKASIINTEKGPVFLDSNSKVSEGSIIQGPFYLGKNSELNLGAKIRGNVAIGPMSKVGGEVSKSIIQGHSNKAHDGYLGNSFIGEWCNLGADTNTSNMKNNYSTVQVFDYATKGFVNSGIQFCGLTMGDHSKCSINTMFNTGTVVGVSSSIFGGGFPEKHIPSFSWGGQKGNITTYDLEKALKTAEIVMSRRNIELTSIDMTILKKVYAQTDEFRSW